MLPTLMSIPNEHCLYYVKLDKIIVLSYFAVWADCLKALVSAGCKDLRCITSIEYLYFVV